MNRGALYMVFAGVFFTAMITAVKVTREEMSPFAIIFWRSVIGVPLTIALARGQLTSLARPGVVLLRCVIGFLAMGCVFTAARGLSIADLSILHKLQPLVVGALAPLVLGAAERAGKAWGALIVGFSGAALLMGPELQIGGYAGLLAVAGAVLSAIAHVVIRSLGRDHRPIMVVLAFQASCVVLAAPVTWVVDGHLEIPDLALAPYLFAISACAAMGQLCMTTAYQLDKAARVAAVSYLAPLWGVLTDIAVFGLLPEPLSLVGGALVLGAGLWLIVDRPVEEQS